MIKPEEVVELRREYEKIKNKLDENEYLYHLLTTPGAVLLKGTISKRKALPPELRHLPVIDPEKYDPTYIKHLIEVYRDKLMKFEDFLIEKGGEDLLKRVTDDRIFLGEYYRYLSLSKELVQKHKEVLEKLGGLNVFPWVFDERLNQVLMKYAGRLNRYRLLKINFELGTYPEINYEFHTEEVASRPVSLIMFIEIYNKKTLEQRKFLTLQDCIQEIYSRWVFEVKKFDKDRGWYDKYIPRQWKGLPWYSQWAGFLEDNLKDWELLYRFNLAKIVGPAKIPIKKVLDRGRFDPGFLNWWAKVTYLVWYNKEYFENFEPYSLLVDWDPDWRIKKRPDLSYFYEKPYGITQEEADLAYKILSSPEFKIEKEKIMKIKKKVEERKISIGVTKMLAVDVFQNRKVYLDKRLNKLVDKLKEIELNYKDVLIDAVKDINSRINVIFKIFLKELPGKEPEDLIIEGLNLVNCLIHWINATEKDFEEMKKGEISEGSFLSISAENLKLCSSFIKDTKLKTEVEYKLNRLIKEAPL
jgi:hypothetical protein